MAVPKPQLTPDEISSMTDEQLRVAARDGQLSREALDLELGDRRASPAPDTGNPYGTPNHLPRGAGNQYAAVLNGSLPQGAPKLPVGGSDAPPDPNAGLSGENSVAALQPVTTPPNAAGGASEGNQMGMPIIDPNAPEVRSQTTTGSSRLIESDAHRAAMGDIGRASEEAKAAETVRAQHAYEAGQQLAAHQQGVADQLKAGNDQYQAKVQARQAQLADAQKRIDQASADFAEAAKGAPAGSVLNPQAGQVFVGAIAQALGAFGAGMTGGRNSALELLNTQIDTALKQQHERVVSARTKVSMAEQHLQNLRDIYKDDDAAHLAAKADLLEYAGVKAQQLAALAGSQAELDKGAAFKAETDMRAAQLREQAALRHEQTVESHTTTSTESGPSIAARAVAAQYAAVKAQREAEGGTMKYTPQQVQDQTQQEDAHRDAVQAIQRAGGVPPQVMRQLQMWGGSLKDWQSIVANVAADNTMTQEQKNAATSLMRDINVRLFHDSGKQVTPEEAPRHLAGYGLGPSATPTDVLRNLRVQGENLTRERTRMITADPYLQRVFAAGDLAVKQAPQGPTPGTPVGK